MTTYLSERSREVLSQVLIRDTEALLKARAKRRRQPDYRAEFWEGTYESEDKFLLLRAQRYGCVTEIEALLEAHR